MESPAINRFGAITVPTLVVVGERDLPNFLAVADILRERILDAHKVAIPGVGHMSNMEDPKRSNEVVLGFLAGV